MDATHGNFEKTKKEGGDNKNENIKKEKKKKKTRQDPEQKSKSTVRKWPITRDILIGCVCAHPFYSAASTVTGQCKG